MKLLLNTMNIYNINIKVQEYTIDTLSMPIIFSVVNYMAKWN